MKKRVVSTLRLRFRDVSRALALAVLFCFQINLLCALAQESKVLSEKPVITQVFDPARNETEVSVILSSNSFSADKSTFTLGGKTVTIYGPGSSARTQSGLVLGYASHTYEGRTQTGKQNASFTFFSKHKDTFKDQPAFSIIIDGQATHGGKAEQPSQLDLKGDYWQKIKMIVPTQVLLQIASAKKVQFNIGPKIYKLEGFQQKSIRALADTFDAQKK
jgi:hypothetical protein